MFTTKNVASNRGDAREEELSGCPIKGHEEEIPCLSEGGCFMSEDSYTRVEVHPYKHKMEYAKSHPEFDINSVTVFAEADYFDEFSYATEHLSYDAVISVLLQTFCMRRHA